MARRRFDPFELQASRDALAAIADGLSGYAVERIGNSALAVWLLSEGGQVWLIGVDQRDLEYKFEVFTLAIETIEEVQARWANWRPVPLPAAVPENLRQLLTSRPPMPAPPSEFFAWPFGSWRTDVLRRAEIIVEGVGVGPIFGSNPVAQDAVRPGAVPPEAGASCEVAAGLLFSGHEGGRLLMAVDWMPMNMVVEESAVEIDAFLASCEQVSLAEYLERVHPTA